MGFIYTIPSSFRSSSLKFDFLRAFLLQWNDSLFMGFTFEVRYKDARHMFQMIRIHQSCSFSQNCSKMASPWSQKLPKGMVFPFHLALAECDSFRNFQCWPQQITSALFHRFLVWTSKITYWATKDLFTIFWSNLFKQSMIRSKILELVFPSTLPQIRKCWTIGFLQYIVVSAV